MSDDEQQTNKRKQVEELEVDLEAPVPQSKRQKRLEKKGKKASKASTKPDKMEDLYELEAEKGPEKQSADVKTQYGVWIGNLSFDTTKEDLVRFLVLKTQDEDDEEDQITTENITRVNMPRGKGKASNNKGFAYVDFKTPQLVKSCIALSEQNLNGRNLLIKNSKSFEGRPPAGANKNPPSRILFVGNLSFDTTQEQLERHYMHCGEIVKIRMATFEDSGNCKGFAFVDFMEIESATKALRESRCKKLNGRLLRMEYGEDRSKRTKGQKQQSLGQSHGNGQEIVESAEPAGDFSETPAAAKKKQRKAKGREADRRPKPGQALASAQRAKVGIVPSAGKKMTFAE